MVFNKLFNYLLINGNKPPFWYEYCLETAKEMVMRDQPNSRSSGTIRMPGVDRTAALMISARKATAATTQASTTSRRRRTENRPSR